MSQHFGTIGLWRPYGKPIPQQDINRNPLPSVLGIQLMVEIETQRKFYFSRVEGDQIFEPGCLVMFDLVLQEMSAVGKAAWAKVGRTPGGPTLVPTNVVKAMRVPSFAKNKLLGFSYRLYDADIAARVAEIKRQWISWGRNWPV